MAFLILKTSFYGLQVEFPIFLIQKSIFRIKIIIKKVF